MSFETVDIRDPSDVRFAFADIIGPSRECVRDDGFRALAILDLKLEFREFVDPASKALGRCPSGGHILQALVVSDDRSCRVVLQVGSPGTKRFFDREKFLLVDRVIQFGSIHLPSSVGYGMQLAIGTSLK